MRSARNTALVTERTVIRAAEMRYEDWYVDVFVFFHINTVNVVNNELVIVFLLTFLTRVRKVTKESRQGANR